MGRREANPDRLARALLSAEFHHQATGLRTLQYWQGEFSAWRDGVYRTIPDQELRAVVNQHVTADFAAQYRQALIEYRLNQGRAVGPRPKLRDVTSRIVTDVVGALQALALIPVARCRDLPAWVDGVSPWPAGEVMPTASELVHLPSLAEGRPCTARPTPNFFGRYNLEFPYAPDAAVPLMWTRFLNECRSKDHAAILTLQEWMGYLLTADTSHQKIALLIGPPRSGKGTIARVIRGLVGTDNAAAPTLSGLATNFGLAPLLGKPIAIIADARVSSRTDAAVVIERLLSISGEDDQTVDRKNREPVTTKLPTRLMILSNELPSLRDASGTLAGRLLILKMTESFAGREDRALFAEKLEPELPGILRWAVEGWARLRRNRRFTGPSDVLGLARTMADVASPIGAFLRERCRVGDDESVLSRDLFDAWKVWCIETNQHAGEEAEFGRNLNAAIPNLGRKHPREKDRSRPWRYTGVRLLSGDERESGEASGSGWSRWGLGPPPPLVIE